MFDLVLGLFLLITPIVFMPVQVGNINALVFYAFNVFGNCVSYYQWLWLIVGILVLFITATLSKPQREFNSKWSVILLSLFGINVFLHPIGARLFSNIFLGFLLYYLVVVYTVNYKSLFKFIFIVSLLNTIFAILQLFGIHWIYMPTNRIDGLMCLSTHLGMYQAIVLPICYSLNPFLAIVPAIGIILSKSVTAIAILIVLILFKLYHPIKLRWKTINIINMPLMLLILTSIMVFVLGYKSNLVQKLNIRLMVWIPTIKQILQRPFTGYGIKPFVLQSPMGIFLDHCSVYFDMIWMLGLSVLIPLCMMVKDIFKSIDKTILVSLVIALFCCIEKSIMFYPRLAGTIIVLLAIANITKGVVDVNKV